MLNTNPTISLFLFFKQNLYFEVLKMSKMVPELQREFMLLDQLTLKYLWNCFS